MYSGGKKIIFLFREELNHDNDIQWGIGNAKQLCCAQRGRNDLCGRRECETKNH